MQEPKELKKEMPQKHFFHQSAVFSWRAVLDGGKSQVDPEHITSVLHALVERCANKGIFSLSLCDLKTTAICTNELKERERLWTQIILAITLIFLKLACFNKSYKLTKCLTGSRRLCLNLNCSRCCFLHFLSNSSKN